MQKKKRKKTVYVIPRCLHIYVQFGENSFSCDLKPDTEE